MTRSRLPLLLGLAVTLGACAGSAPPRTAPERASAPAPARPAARDTRAAADSARPAAEAPQRKAAPAPAAAPEAPARSAVAADDVKRRTIEVFGDSAAAQAAADSLAADSVAADTLPSEGEVEEDETDGLGTGAYATNERVARYVEIFSGRQRESMETWLERGTRYEGMIRERLRRADLPEDLVYLALIESGYDPNAYSRASAVGMWQFMTPTARGMGLRVDWWVDERRDPVKSTDAAARFLKYLKAQFGSMYLAAAAYNGGPGRVARGLEKYADDLEGAEGDDRFFALAEQKYLPKETKDYVPKLIAAAIVAREPARYGLAVRPQPAYAFDSVRVPSATPLAAVARAAGVRTSEVRELNPHVLRGITPPTKGPHWVRVPVGAAAEFDSAFRALPDDDRRAFTKVVTKKYQTMASVARAHGLAERQLAWYNKSAGKLKNGNLRPGQTLLVPSAAVVAAARDVPDPTERRGKGGRTVVHLVRRGETLSGIARRYDLSVAALMRLNGLRKQMIFEGQALVVRGSGRPSAAAMRAAKADLRRAATSGKGSAKPATQVAGAKPQGRVRLFTLSTVARMPKAKPAPKPASKAAKSSAKSKTKAPAKKPAAKGKSTKARAKSTAKSNAKPAPKR